MKDLPPLKPGEYYEEPAVVMTEEQYQELLRTHIRDPLKGADGRVTFDSIRSFMKTKRDP